MYIKSVENSKALTGYLFFLIFDGGGELNPHPFPPIFIDETIKKIKKKYMFCLKIFEQSFEAKGIFRDINLVLMGRGQFCPYQID